MDQEQQATLMNNHHYLIVFFPLQGHINPSLQLAKNLVRNGAKVTLGTTNRGLKQIKSLPTLKGLSYASILDGQETDDFQTHKDFLSCMADLRRIGPQNLSNLLRKFLADGEPVTLLVYSIILPWAAAVAREIQVPSAFLFNQCATVLTIYHRFLNSQDGIHGKINSSPSIEVSGLPLFSSSDIPTFLLPDTPFSGFFNMMQEHIQVLEENPRSFVLVNTFEELEQESVKAIANMNVIAVGPLIPSAFCDGNDLTDKSFGGDLFCQSEDYFEWLDSKPKRSVIYASFGSLAVLKKEQKEEIFHALVESGRPFLWVLRSSNSEEEEVHKMMGNRLNGDGIIVPWCSQVEVLSHRSIGCFVTHCGWNSTLESMVSGVPISGCPQFSDQTTNAKIVDEVWVMGVSTGGHTMGPSGSRDPPTKNVFFFFLSLQILKPSIQLKLSSIGITKLKMQETTAHERRLPARPSMVPNSNFEAKPSNSGLSLPAIHARLNFVDDSAIANAANGKTERVESRAVLGKNGIFRRRFRAGEQTSCDSRQPLVLLNQNAPLPLQVQVAIFLVLAMVLWRKPMF